MFMRILFFILITICCNHNLQAQKTISYYTVKWELCQPENAAYISVVEKKDSLWYRVDYFASPKKLFRDAYFKDAATTIKQGMERTFYTGGLWEQIIQYNNNLKEGVSISLYPNKLLIDSFNFKASIPYGICSSWYPNGKLMTEMQMDTTGNGSGLVIGFFENGQVSFKGKLGKGLRKQGNWFYYHENGNRAAVLQYATADSNVVLGAPQIKYDAFEKTYYDSTVLLTNTICYNTDGVQQQACEFVNKPAEYSGGISKWTSYLTNVLPSVVQRYTIDEPVRYKAIFMVNTAGKPEFTMLDNKINDAFDADILRVIEKSGKWLPAQHNNRVIPYTHIQSLTLGGYY